ncbi:MAG: NAD(P)-dependent oxidoreductase [Planctomycetota bacterium]|jgi:3-hydroxyisobutyrate dehydrogenase-like beta-hydroxyacid dehydrogenase
MTDGHVNGKPAIGFLGLGQMGGPMARGLVAAGYRVTAFDPIEAKLDACTSAGAGGASSAAEAIGAGEVVMTSLRSSDMFAEVAETILLPNAREGHVFIDMGTTAPPRTRRFAAELAEKGAVLLDAPVSGSAASGMLRIFVGGDEGTARRMWPIFEVLGDPEHVAYCGPSGSGQAVKGTNQLAMGLVDAAYLEAVAFGVQAGASVESILKGVGQESGGGFRSRVARVAKMVLEKGDADGILVKFPELQYFLAEAREKGFPLPMTEALFEFLDPGPRDWVDNMKRPRVAYWHELMRRRDIGGAEATGS